MSERMDVKEVEELTGLCRNTLYHMMESGQVDLGAVVRGKEKNTYVFFRPKVERFVSGDESEHYRDLVRAVRAMNELLVIAIHQGGGDAVLRELCTN